MAKGSGAAAARARLEWYLQRLQVMGPAEIAHRGREAARRTIYRHRTPHPPRVARENAPGEVIRPLLLTLAAVPGATAHWEAMARQFEAGSVTLLGQTWQLTPSPNWRLDPQTGMEWPTGYAFDIDYRHAATLGEAKYVWELSRLLYLLPVAAYADRTASGELCRQLQGQVDDWIERNPAFHGVAWASGIEAALRIVAMVAVDEMVQRVRPDEAFADRVHAAVFDHVDWLCRFPSRYSSANNHRVAELSGLLVAAVKYRSVARRLDVDRLTAELDRVASALFFADGVGAEQSTSYAAFSLEWLAVTAGALTAAARTVPAGLLATMRRAALALDAMTDVKGNVVRYGDDDDGRVLTAAVPIERFFDGVRALLPPVVAGDAAAAASARPAGLRTFADGGYTVARTTDVGNEVLWVLDHGPLGFGELAAHGHADALAVWLHVAGFPVFVDAGTYLYHSGGSWREYMRTTDSHNTVTFAGLSSSLTAGNFNWRRNRRATGALCSQRPGPEWLVEAEHDGYVVALGVVHRRTVQRLGEGWFRITDRAVGSRAVDARWSMLLAPDLEAASLPDGWLVTRDGVEVLRLTTSSDFTAATLRGSETPRAGWHSARFGSVEPAAALVLQGQLAPGAALDVDVVLANAPSGGRPG